MNRVIDASVYDENIRAEGLQCQIDNYYEPVAAAQQRRIDLVMNALSSQAGERILDIGCGVGTFAYHAARRGARTVGVDYSHVSLQTAQELAGRFGTAQRSEFVTGNCLRLPFADAVFDKIVAADFVEHITDAEKVILLNEVYRVLKPGGRGVVFTPNLMRERLGEAYWRLRHTVRGDRMPHTDLHYGLITRRRFERLLRAAGFCFTAHYADTTRPWLARLPGAKHVLALNLIWIICRPKTFAKSY